MSHRSPAFYLSLILTISLSVIAIDSIIPAIPLLTHAFGASASQGQLTIGLYLAGYSLGQIPVGLAADRYGRLPVLFAGMALFTVMSLVTVLANSMELLLIARFLQGVAGTVGPVLARAVIRDTHQGPNLARMMAIMVTALAAGAMVAPILGTVLVMLSGWQAPLVLNVVVGVAVLFLLWRFVPETHQATDQGNVWQQVRSSSRLFFTTPAAVWGTVLVGATFFAYFSIATGLGSVLVDYYHFPADVVGWGFAAAVVFYMASAQWGRVMVKRHNKLTLIYLGALGYLLAVLIGGTALLLASLGIELALPWLACTIVAFLCGMGLIFANASAITLDPIPQIAGYAASLLGTAQMGLGTLGAMLTALLYRQHPASLLVVMVTGAAVSVLLIALQKRCRFVTE
ncbi:MFS transporter [Saccharospirillum mangrovi]|uniref:MFS transporter n=1 Tax=Saccharospirillum mangrovi TaxID=2161747 RepID=UPI000D371DE0|nr:MFS transporter [Saccharospirillum mangrovi]